MFCTFLRMQSAFLKGFTDKQQKPYSIVERLNNEKGKFKMVKRLLSAIVYKLFILIEKIYWHTGIDIMPVWMRVNICEFQGEMRKEK